MKMHAKLEVFMFSLWRWYRLQASGFGRFELLYFYANVSKHKHIVAFFCVKEQNSN